MFQEHHGIKFNDQEHQQDCRRVHQGRWNMDFFRTQSAKYFLGFPVILG
jgi:hypothetical protein